MLAGVAAQIPYNQKVGIEAHLVNHAQLVIQALAVFWQRRTFAIFFQVAGFAERTQIAFGGAILGDGKLGQMIAFETQVNIAAFSNQERIVDRLGDICKQRSHFSRGAQIIGIIGHAHPLGVGQQTAGLDGEQNILQAGIFLVDVMHIVGSDELRIVAAAQGDQVFVDLIQFFDIVRLQLKEKAFFTEDLIIPIQVSARPFQVALLDQTRHLCGHAARCTN